MAGHNKWKQIKDRKAAQDKKKSQVFSKIVHAITVAAKNGGTDPSLNPTLKSLIAQAKAAKVPSENIKRAIQKATAAQSGLESITIEAYGIGGAAIMVVARTDNRNRTIQEIKTALNELNGKWAEPGSVRWAFEKNSANEWQPKFYQTLPPEEFAENQKLIEALSALPDVEKVYSNAKQEN